MPDLTPAATTWLATHHGVITSAELRRCDVTAATVRRLTAAGVLRRPTRGVFVDATAAGTLEQRCAELSMTHPSGFVTGPTAGMLAGLRRIPPMAALHFSVHHGLHLPELRGVVWRQTTAIEAGDRRRREDGIVVASWSRLAFDLAADLRPLHHLSVVHQLLADGHVTADGLLAIDRRLGHAARPGSGVFRRTLIAMNGHTANDSHPEVVLAEALRRHDVPVVHQARVIRSANGQVFYVDLAVPEARWGVELDIHPEHRSYEGHAADAARRREMHRLAWQVETVSEHDMGDPERLAKDLASLYVVRRRQLLAHPSAS